MPQSKSDEHITPDNVFTIIKNRWGYERDQFFDPCPVNGTSGLDDAWQKLNFVNPPYGIKKGNTPSLLELFVWKAHHETQWFNKVSIMLLPVKTDQGWFHDYIIDPKFKYEIEWIRKRLHFKNNKWSATQPHFLVKMEKT
jgi:hypothetical protein